MSEQLEKTKQLLLRLKEEPQSFTYEIAALTAEAASDLIEGLEEEHAQVIYNYRFDVQVIEEKAKRNVRIAKELLGLIKEISDTLPERKQAEVEKILEQILEREDTERQGRLSY